MAKKHMKRCLTAVLTPSIGGTKVRLWDNKDLDTLRRGLQGWAGPRPLRERDGAGSGSEEGTGQLELAAAAQVQAYC